MSAISITIHNYSSATAVISIDEVAAALKKNEKT